MTDICHRKQNKNLSNTASIDQLQKENSLLMDFQRIWEWLTSCWLLWFLSPISFWTFKNTSQMFNKEAPKQRMPDRRQKYRFKTAKANIVNTVRLDNWTTCFRYCSPYALYKRTLQKYSYTKYWRRIFLLCVIDDFLKLQSWCHTTFHHMDAS